MSDRSSAVFNRPDTFLGVCEAIGQDFGVNANILRVLLGVGLIWQPLWMLSIYVTLGIGVAVSRLLFPTPRAVAEPKAEPAPVPGNDADQPVLAKAA
jgi:phage shock protein C